MLAHNHLRAIRPGRSLLAAALLAAGRVGALPAQVPTVHPIVSRAPRIRLTDARLAAAFDRLVAGSPTARAVVAALSVSDLEVAIGTPRELAALPDSQGGPGRAEKTALLSDPGTRTPNPEPPIAWVVFRMAPPAPGAPVGSSDEVKRAWVVVEADSVTRWIREADGPRATELIQNDLLAILAHEFVAHVGSIARTRRLADFCDDPPPSASLPQAGPAPDLACSLRVENQVRRELNRGLRLEGPHRLPERKSYALDVMHFGRAYLKTH